MRLDKFLKVSRLIKRRTVANKTCDAENVLVNGRPAKPSYRVKVGDVLTLSSSARSLSFRVTAVAENVSKDEASSLYEVIE
ncbi:MAG: RNA-binding S4 domain-containing protein [Clostridia bacterium]|nr:RNA-binding S4 domain-containing protein [Clostridia bacterium]